MCQKIIPFIFSLWKWLVKIKVSFFFYYSPDARNSTGLELICSHQKMLVTFYLIRYNFIVKLTLIISRSTASLLCPSQHSHGYKCVLKSAQWTEGYLERIPPAYHTKCFAYKCSKVNYNKCNKYLYF